MSGYSPTAATCNHRWPTLAPGKQGALDALSGARVRCIDCGVDLRGVRARSPEHLPRDLCDRLEDEGNASNVPWVRHLVTEAATEISRLRDENARHLARQELFLSELTVLREERVDTKGPWSGVWNNWIAPYHACPRCGKSLNWVQGEDVFDRPLISTNCCGVIHQAKLLWPHESTVAADRRARTAAAEK